MRWKFKSTKEFGSIDRSYKFALFPKKVWEDDTKKHLVLIWLEGYELRHKWSIARPFGGWEFEGLYAVDVVDKVKKT